MQLSRDHRRYLEVLGVVAAAPSLDHLCRLVRAHLQRVPFENISKLYYLKRDGLRAAPDLAIFLDGIESSSFGGTCYSSNIHLFGLLQALGYDARLCGSDLSEPDVHITIMVELSGREYMVDVGYAAPFDRPMPRDLDHDLAISLGNEEWVLMPQDDTGRSRMEHRREGEIIHGYTAKPEQREPEHFRTVIEDSFRADSTFMNAVRLVRFHDRGSVAVSNLNLVRATPGSCEIQRLTDTDELARVVEAEFGIPSAITTEALEALAGPLSDMYRKTDPTQEVPD